jgi:hypothetical protein
MTFEEAEARFRELQARVQRGESISRAEYEDQVSQLAVQDRNGVLWEINPRTGKWMYFDGAEWVSGTPPGHETSAVIPTPGKVVPPPGAQPVTAPTTPPPIIAPSAPTPPPRVSTPPPARPAVSLPVPPRPVTPPTATTAPASKSAPESLKPYVRPQDKSVTAAPAGGLPGGGPSRASPLEVFGPNREWIPLAIGAVVLFICAILLFFGGSFALGAFGGTKPIPTRAPLPTLPATPVPTVVRLPTQPPPTATPAQVLAKVAETKVNVRGGPSTKDKIISSVKKNDQLTLVGRNSDNTWFQINIAGSTAPGWIFAQTLQIVSGDPNTLPVASPPTPTPKPGAPPAVQPTPTLAPLGTLPTPTSQP